MNSNLSGALFIFTFNLAEIIILLSSGYERPVVFIFKQACETCHVTPALILFLFCSTVPSTRLSVFVCPI